jgi:hypothetical protein
VCIQKKREEEEEKTLSFLERDGSSDRSLLHTHSKRGKKKSIKSIPQHTSGRINMVRIEQQQQQLRWIGKNGKKETARSAALAQDKKIHPSLWCWKLFFRFGLKF